MWSCKMLFGCYLYLQSSGWYQLQVGMFAQSKFLIEFTCCFQSSTNVVLLQFTDRMNIACYWNLYCSKSVKTFFFLSCLLFKKLNKILTEQRSLSSHVGWVKSRWDSRILRDDSRFTVKGPAGSQVLWFPEALERLANGHGCVGVDWVVVVVVCVIHTNKLRSYGSKLVGKTSPECPEHSPKLGAQLPRNNFCHLGEYARDSEEVQLSAVWCTVHSFCTQ